MAQSTVEMIGDYWVFGTGLEAYDEAYPIYRRLGGRKDILEPHQLPLALPAEMGVLGLIAEVVIVLGVGIEMFTRRVRGFDAWESVALAGLVALLVQSLFQYYLYFEYLWVFLALTVAASRLSRSVKEV
jgi:O-antigen ligase